MNRGRTNEIIEQGITTYANRPVRIAYVCRCGARMDMWPEVMEAHKQQVCPLRVVSD